MSSEFDIIFAGAGTTACVVAGRLIAADPSLKILVVERGQHTRDLPIHVQPCRFFDNIAPASSTVSVHAAKPSDELNGRPFGVSVGKCVGGGSAVNFMAYVCGAASDYDDWVAFGNQGWSFDELLPLIKKIETFNPKAEQPTHGYDGPIQVSPPQPDLAMIGQQFLDVGREYDPHRPQVDDCNDFKTANAYSPWNKYINPKTGRRSDAASAYLYPHAQNPNLEIRVGMCVKCIIIKDGRAVGIEYTADGTSSPEGTADIVTAMASKLVVVSAGAMGSPAILERSGIGNPSILKSVNVPVKVNLPGVGENYKDHIGAFSSFHAADDALTLDDVWNDEREVLARLAEWQDSGKGKIACNGFDALMKFRPTTSELESIGPAFQSRWESFFQCKTDKPVAIIEPAMGYLGHSTASSSGMKFFTMGYFLLYPESFGSVHITCGENVNAPLTFDPRFFSDAGDIACVTLLYKKAREIARRMPAYRGEAAFLRPLFAANSPAACRETDEPVPIDAPDITYSSEDDEAIVSFHRNSLIATYHSLGTCAMKSREQGGVVDSRLNVYGVQGLKVADLSICPTNVGNNTYSTAMLVGEKAAAIIAQELGVKLA